MKEASTPVAAWPGPCLALGDGLRKGQSFRVKRATSESWVKGSEQGVGTESGKLSWMLGVWKEAGVGGQAGSVETRLEAQDLVSILRGPHPSQTPAENKQKY